MPQMIHINGEAALQVGTGGNGALRQLGVSLDGVSIAVVDHTIPIPTDDWGGPDGTPYDEMYLSTDATVRCTLVLYDSVVLASIRGRPNADGVLGTPGSLWRAGGGYYRLLIESPEAEEPWNFPAARLKDAAETKIGTRRSVWDLIWFATLTPPLSQGPTVLFNRNTN